MDEQIQQLLKRRDELAAQISRIEGRKEQAQTTLEQIRQECKERGVDPDQLDETIEKLELRLAEGVKELEDKIRHAEKQLSKYVG